MTLRYCRQADRVYAQVGEAEDSGAGERPRSADGRCCVLSERGANSGHSRVSLPAVRVKAPPSAVDAALTVVSECVPTFFEETSKGKADVQLIRIQYEL